MKLDSYDLKILETLQRDGRIAKVKLAEAVNLSTSPAWERLKKLEQSGIIAGYRAQIDLKKLGAVTEVLVQVTLAHHQAEDFRRFEEGIQTVPEVVDCWATGGGIDYLMRLVVADVDEYQRLMDRLLEGDFGIDRYFGYVVTKPVKAAAPPIKHLLQKRSR